MTTEDLKVVLYLFVIWNAILSALVLYSGVSVDDMKAKFKRLEKLIGDDDD